MFDQVVAEDRDIFNDSRIYWISDDPLSHPPPKDVKIPATPDGYDVEHYKKTCKTEGECEKQRDCCEGQVCMRLDKSVEIWYCIDKERLYD